MRDAKPKLLQKAFEAEGFTVKSTGKHIKLVKVVEGRTLTVNIQHGKITKRCTVEALRKQAEISKEVFYSYKF